MISRLNKHPITEAARGLGRRWKEKLLTPSEYTIQLMEEQKDLKGDEAWKNLREYLRLKNLFYAYTLPWKATPPALLATYLLMYPIQNIASFALPDIKDALKRYDVTTEEVADLPKANIRFHFGGEPSSLFGLTRTSWLPTAIFEYQQSAHPAGDHAVGTLSSYHWLNKKLTGLCTIASKSNPELAHQALATMANVSHEYAAHLIQGREQAYSLYVLLHEARHCDPNNQALSGSEREADADIYALKTLRNLKQFPNIEDLVLIGRVFNYGGTHDTILSLAAFIQGKPIPNQTQIADAINRIDNWARPYTNKYSNLRSNEKSFGTKFREYVYALKPDNEDSVTAYLLAWNERKSSCLNEADQRAFDRLEMLLAAYQAYSSKSFTLYEKNASIQFEPTSNGKLIKLDPQPKNQKVKTANTSTPLRPQ